MKRKIFLGHSTPELTQHRSKLRELLCKIDSAWTCVSADYLEDTGIPPDSEEIRRLILLSDLFVMLVGHLYDTNKMKPEGLSPIVAEFNIAKENGKNMIVFMASEDFSLPARFLKEVFPRHIRKQIEFRNKIKRMANDSDSDIILVCFDSVDDLLHKAEVEFHKWLRFRQYSASSGEPLSYFVLKFGTEPIIFPKTFVRYAFLKNFANLHLPVLTSNVSDIEVRRNQMSQDMIPFVPILVEITKFMLGEVSQWIRTAREKKKISKETAESIELPRNVISDEGLSKALQNPVLIFPFLNEIPSDLVIHEIQSLKRQIELQKKVLDRLEEQVIIAAGGEKATIQVQIDEAYSEIVSKAQRLSALLRRVYKYPPTVSS